MYSSIDRSNSFLFCKIIFFLLSIVRNVVGQAFNEYPNTGLSIPIIDQHIHIVKDKPYVLDYNFAEGWSVYDIKSGKKILVKTTAGIDEMQTAKHPVMLEFGVVKDIFYFSIVYQLINNNPLDDDRKFERTELWCFDGEQNHKIEMPVNVKFSGLGSLEFYNTGNCIYIPDNTGSSSDYIKLEGTIAKKVAGPQGAVNSYGGGLLLQRASSTDILLPNDKIFNAYRGNDYQIIHLTCNKAFLTEKKGENIVLGTFENSTDIEMKGISYISQLQFSHGTNQLIYGYQENPSDNVMAGPKDGLYITDGTKLGTKHLSRQIFSNPDFLKWVTSSNSYQGLTFFVICERNQNDGKFFYTIWKTDGTPQGTKTILTSKKKIWKVFNHKGFPVYVRDSSAKAGVMFTIRNNKETPIFGQGKMLQSMLFKIEENEDLGYRYDLKRDGRLYILLDKSRKKLSTVDLLPEVKYFPEQCSEVDLTLVPAEAARMIEICGRSLYDDYGQFPKDLQHLYKYKRRICSAKSNPYCTVDNVYNFMLKDVNYQAPESYSILKQFLPSDGLLTTSGPSTTAMLLSAFRNYERSLPEKVVPDKPGLVSKARGINKVSSLKSSKRIVDCAEYILMGPGSNSDPLTANTGDQVLSILGKFIESDPDLSYNFKYTDGQVMPYENPILVNTYPQDHKIINRTLPGHFLDPGKVSRTVSEEDGYVVVQTIGEGATTNQKLNLIIGGIFFKVIDETLMTDFFDVTGSPRAWQEYQKLK